MKLISTLHEKLGDLWWYTILLFIAQRMGDVINMFIGLWLVPKYVPQNELGAVLPLTQFVSLIGLPMGLVAIPFMKYLNIYASRGELGKIKSLTRDVFAGTGILAVVTFAVAYFLLPILFTRMRVASGSLGILIVGVSILSSISVIFQNAVQGLKLFSVTVWCNVVAAPFRLLLMCVFMPFRPLSGYFVGQGAAPGTSIIGAFWALRKKLGKAVSAVPYWREDGRGMIRYAVPIAINTILAVVVTSVEQLVIRHRLSDFESAGYYMISRFADIASYMGSVFVVFLFPLVAGSKAKDRDSLKLLSHSMLGSMASGIAVAALLFFFGEMLMGLVSTWKAYQPLSGHMALLALVNVSIVVGSCLITYETAQGRFGFLRYIVPILTMKAVGLYALTGYSYFYGILPNSWLDAVANFNPNRLGVLLWFFLAFNMVSDLCLVVDVFGRRINVAIRWRLRLSHLQGGRMP